MGDSKPLILTASPAYADVPEVTWTSSNDAVATVDKNGIVTGVKTGVVTITATAKNNSSLTASVELLVRSSYTYDVGWSGTFTSADNNTTTTAAIPVDPNEIEKIWDVKVGNNTIAIVDGYIYTYDGVNTGGGTDNNGTLYKVDKASGEIVDKLTCEMSTGYYYSYIIYGGGILYVSGINKVMAVDPDSFTVLWYAEVPETFYCTAQFVADCIVTRDIVLNSTTGERIATLEGTYNYSSGVEKNGLFYIASTEGKLYAFDTENWEVKDELTFRGSSEGVQPGVMSFNGRLYWSDNMNGNMYSVALDEEGMVDESTLKTTACGIQTVCVPVAASDRVYLAGSKNGEGVVGVFNAGNLSLVYTAEGANDKIQSTPILRTVSADGPSIMSLDIIFPSALSNGNYLVVQDFGDGTGSARSCLRVLKDVSGATSGSMNRLTTIEPQDFAYEQLACDKDGSLYCTNDSGYLVKYQNATVKLPVITENLSTAEVLYEKDAEAAAMKITATVSDGGTLSYQWQSRIGTGSWKDISGATGTTYVPSTAVEGTTYYRCVVKNTLDDLTTETYSRTAKITVLGDDVTVICGDVNYDGKVNAKDVTTLRRHLADWDGYELSALQKAAADVNADSEVGADDATRLARYLAGWSGVTIENK